MRPTFSLQSTLPRLPVPSLQDTLSLYLSSIRPFQTPAEHEKSKAVIEDFRTSRLAESLQERLIDIDRHSPEHWLADFWLKKGYLGRREPLMVNSNWFATGLDDHDHPQELLTPHAFPDRMFSHFQIRRAATMAYNGADFVQQIENQTYPIFVYRKRSALCMHQYSQMICMNRIPFPRCDQLFQQDSTKVLHIAVLACDQVYTLNIFDLVEGKKQRVPVDRLEAELLAIASHASSGINAQKQVPLLTAWDRDSWAGARNHLLTLDPIGNRKSLRAIEDALFVLCLDDGSANPPSSLGKAALFGHPSRGPGHNRWFDKTISFIVENNGRASVMGEHSPVDGVPVDYFLYFVLKVSVVQATGSATDTPWLTCAVAPQITSPSVHHLTWTTDVDVDGFLDQAQASANASSKKVLFHNLLFEDFGNDAMRKAAKLPLDSLYHMVMQLTFYRLYGTITPTYETAQTTMFRSGRSETIRVCSVESKRFVEAFDDPQIPEKETFDLLVKSTLVHKKYTVLASTGRGCDRHLMVLRLLNLDHSTKDGVPLHPIFTDPVFMESQTFGLSASGMEEEARLLATGFYNPYGHGIAYVVSANCLTLGISSANTEKVVPPEQFGNVMAKTLHDVLDLCKRFGAADLKPNL